MTYNAVSLFSGAGGLDVGFKQSGKFKILFANDKNPSFCKTYSKNLKLKLEEIHDSGYVEAEPGKIFACDVSKIIFSSLSECNVDVVLGGPPCQDFSVAIGPARDRKGIKVERGKLYAHFVRALAVLQPKVFVFENVPGLKSANKGRAYKVILEDFRKLKIRWKDVKKVLPPVNGNSGKIHGYKIIFEEILDFSRLGTPQRRERLILIGIREDVVRKRSLEEALKNAVKDIMRGSKKLFRKYPLTPLEVFEGKPLPELEDVYKDVMMQWNGIWNEVKTKRARRWKKEVWEKLTFDVIEDYLTANDVENSSQDELEKAFKEHEALLKELGYFGVPAYSLNPPDLTAELPREAPATVERMKMIPPDENYEFVRGTRWEVEGKSISFIYRRIHPLKPSYTIMAYGGGGTHGYHYDRRRATLKLRERARLQTFPDTFHFFGRPTELRAQIGEAVPPAAGRVIAEALLTVFKILES